MGDIVPVPTGILIGGFGLLRVGNDEVELLGKVIHPGASSEVVGILGATVQHNNEGNRGAYLIGIGCVNEVGTRTRRTLVDVLLPHVY